MSRTIRIVLFATKSLIILLLLFLIGVLSTRSSHTIRHPYEHIGNFTNAHHPAESNQAPVIVTDIREKYASAGNSFEIYLPDPVFTDPDNDTLFVSATLSSGAPLPNWISFTDTGTGTGFFSGEAPDEGSLDLTVTATDPDGLEASSSFQLKISTDVRCGEGEDEENFFVVVESMPELVGGLASLQEKLRYTADALTVGIEGRVIVQFIVGLDGRPYNTRVIRGIGGGLDQEALRVTRLTNFIPGYTPDGAVCVQYSLPIVFREENHPQPGSFMFTPIDDQMLPANEPFQFSIPDTTFIASKFELGEMEAYGRGYSPLPSWITFAANANGGGTFTGTAPLTPDTLLIELKPKNLTVYHPFEIFIQEDVNVSNESSASFLPEAFSLHQNYPNPFNPSTTISFELSETGPVELSVYDSAGRRVRNQVYGILSAGTYNIPFNGSKLSSGLYHYKLQFGNHTKSRSMTLIK